MMFVNRIGFGAKRQRGKIADFLESGGFRRKQDQDIKWV